MAARLARQVVSGCMEWWSRDCKCLQTLLHQLVKTELQPLLLCNCLHYIAKDVTT